MTNTLKGRDFLATTDWTKDELDQVLDLAAKFKRMGTDSRSLDLLKGKTLLLLFFHPSTRTRMSFTAAMHQLGGFAQCPDPSELRLSLQEKPGAGETIKDTARTAERYVDAVGIRLYGRPGGAVKLGEGDAIIQKFAEYAEVPVLNLASDRQHPTQALADIMIMKERLGDIRGKRIVMMWAYSPLLRRPMSQERDATIAAMYGMDVTCVSPEGYDLPSWVTSYARELCAKTGRKVEETHDLKGALEGADVIFPRIWGSSNFATNTREEELRIAAQHKDWRLSDSLLKLTNNAIFINSMPFDRGNEVDDSVADGPNSAIYDQAEDLLHVRKAVLSLTMADGSSLERILNH